MYLSTEYLTTRFPSGHRNRRRWFTWFCFAVAS